MKKSNSRAQVWLEEQNWRLGLPIKVLEVFGDSGEYTRTRLRAAIADLLERWYKDKSELSLAFRQEHGDMRRRIIRQRAELATAYGQAEQMKLRIEGAEKLLRHGLEGCQSEGCISWEKQVCKFLNTGAEPVTSAVTDSENTKAI